MKRLSLFPAATPLRAAPTPKPRPAPAATCLNQFIVCTEEDIMDALRQLQARQHSTCFVSIRHLAQVLGMGEEDRVWFLDALKRMDDAGHILLNCLERPQDLASYSRDWFVSNASAIPCHEVCANPQPASEARAAWPAAPDESTRNPHMQQRRVTSLVQRAAETLQAFARRAC